MGDAHLRTRERPRRRGARRRGRRRRRVRTRLERREPRRGAEARTWSRGRGRRRARRTGNPLTLDDVAGFERDLGLRPWRREFWIFSAQKAQRHPPRPGGRALLDARSFAPRTRVPATMVPLTDDAVAAGASAKTVEDILDANLWPGFDKFRVVQVRAPPRVVRGREGGPVSPRGPGSAASETSSRAIVARRVFSSSRSLRARRAFLPAARAPPRGPSPRRGEKRTISPRLENTTTAGRFFFLVAVPLDGSDPFFLDSRVSSNSSPAAAPASSGHPRPKQGPDPRDQPRAPHVPVGRPPRRRAHPRTQREPRQGARTLRGSHRRIQRRRALQPTRHPRERVNRTRGPREARDDFDRPTRVKCSIKITITTTATRPKTALPLPPPLVNYVHRLV